MSEHEPIFNVPSAVLAALAVLAVIHVGRLALPEEMDAWFVLAMAFIPARYNGYAEALPGGSIATVTSFFSHALIHGNAAHLLLNSAWLLAFGGAVAARIGGWRFIVFSLVCGAAGALTFLVFHWGLLAPVVGASGAVAGLMGGTFRFLFSAIDHGGFALLRTAPRSVRLMPLGEALRDRRILAATAIWIGFNALAGAGLGIMTEGASVAWEAHIGGYFAGLLLFGFFDRGYAAPPG